MATSAESEARVLVPGKGRKGRHPAPDVTGAWRIGLVGATVLAIVGWTDVALLWFPMNFGNAEWEFATTSGTYDALPLGTLGFLGVAAWAVLRGGRRMRKVLGALAMVVSVALMGAALLFGLGLIQGYGLIAEEARWILVRGAVKTGLFAVLYVGLYGWLGMKLVRSRKIRRQS